ncbi:MAG: hypothetical protein ACPGO5_01410 [Patescibacteria group bacterium]
MPEQRISPEQFPPTPETGAESKPVQEQAPAVEAAPKQPAKTPVAKPHIPDDEESKEQLTPEQEQEMEEIEDILEEDLKDVYAKLDPATQKTFKESGEETTKMVFDLVHQTKIKTRRIVSVIAKWLRIIPGINKYFVEQEAKLKTDKVVEMHEHDHSNANTDSKDNLTM